MIRDTRRQAGLTQQAVADRGGVSRSAVAGLETTRDGRTTLSLLNRVATALDTELRAYLEGATAAGQPRDLVHLRHQELVMREAAKGGWRAVPEAALDREARTSRAVDVLLHRHREWAICEVCDWFDDVGGTLRDWDRRLEALGRLAISRTAPTDLATEGPRVGGCWVVRATRRNRRLVSEHRGIFRARFPGSAAAWIAALTTAAPMPAEAALIWVSVDGTRLFPSRLG